MRNVSQKKSDIKKKKQKDEAAAQKKIYIYIYISFYILYFPVDGNERCQSVRLYTLYVSAYFYVQCSNPLWDLYIQGSQNSFIHAPHRGKVKAVICTTHVVN